MTLLFSLSTLLFASNPTSLSPFKTKTINKVKDQADLPGKGCADFNGYWAGKCTYKDGSANEINAKFEYEFCHAIKINNTLHYNLSKKTIQDSGDNFNHSETITTYWNNDKSKLNVKRSSSSHYYYMVDENNNHWYQGGSYDAEYALKDKILTIKVFGADELGFLNSSLEKLPRWQGVCELSKTN